MSVTDSASSPPPAFSAGVDHAGGGRVVIVVDACYTGTGRDGAAFLTGKRTVVPGGYIAQKPKSNVVWTAASAGQTSGPLEAAQLTAWFTYADWPGASWGLRTAATADPSADTAAWARFVEVAGR